MFGSTRGNFGGAIGNFRISGNVSSNQGNFNEEHETDEEQKY